MKTWDAENLLVVEYHGSLIKKKWELFWRMIVYLVKVFLITVQSFLTDTKTERIYSISGFNQQNEWK